MKQLWNTIAVSSLTFIVGMVSFWLMEGREYVTRAEVESKIERESPYIRDRQFIVHSLADTNSTRKELAAAIRANTEVIMDLKVEMARLITQRSDKNRRERDG